MSSASRWVVAPRQSQRSFLAPVAGGGPNGLCVSLHARLFFGSLARDYLLDPVRER